MKDIKNFIAESREDDDQFIEDVKARYAEVKDPYNVRELKVGDIIDNHFHYTAQTPEFFRIRSISRFSIVGDILKERSVRDDGYGQNGASVARPEKDERRGTAVIKVGRDGKLKSGKYGGTYPKLWNGNPVDYYTD